ncbi:hypothetical protein [Nonomuraea sp. NPDC050691]|uniref:hypothetical protein n=1 Tax=Nonomuraea sp. NPDC050691 TaxID=3155661 RepID=UPI0033C6281D
MTTWRPASAFFTTRLRLHESVANGARTCLVRPDAVAGIVMRLRGPEFGPRPVELTGHNGIADRLVEWTAPTGG